MKVVAGCRLDTKTIMKDFYFDDGVTEEDISKKVDAWAESLFQSWFVICEPEKEDKYYGE